MEDSPVHENDPVEIFLNARFPGPVDGGLRQSLRAETNRVLRRRRRLKRIGYGATLAACYLLGLATMQVRLTTFGATSGAAALAPDNEPRADTIVSAARTPHREPAQAAAPVDSDQAIPAFVLERMAQSCQESRSLLYRRAGDRYLADGDLRSAVHCYSRSLDAGSPRDWAVSTEDNWLLMQLKTARQEGKHDAKSAG